MKRSPLSLLNSTTMQLIYPKRDMFEIHRYIRWNTWNERFASDNLGVVGRTSYCTYMEVGSTYLSNFTTLSLHFQSLECK